MNAKLFSAGHGFRVWWTCAVAVTALMLSTAAAQAGFITYADGTFNDADWSKGGEAFSPNTFTSGSITVTATQKTTGGNPDEYREIAVAYDNVSPNENVWTFHALAGATYTPTSANPLAYLDGSFDLIRIPTNVNTVAFALAIKQGNKIYQQNSVVAPSGTNWNSFSYTGLTADNFFRRIVTTNPTLSSDTNDHPDFTAGIPLEFGFFSISGSSGTQTRSAGIDNFSVTLAVPEPASAALLLIGGLGLLRRRTAGR